jgi:hypothetical protein
LEQEVLAGEAAAGIVGMGVAVAVDSPAAAAVDTAVVAEGGLVVAAREEVLGSAVLAVLVVDAVEGVLVVHIEVLPVDLQVSQG